MKRLNLPVLALSFAFVAISANLKAQADNTISTHDITVSIPEVALVDIEPTASKNLTMGFTAPTEAGLPIVPASTNNTLWLNYSSIKSVADVTRTISVKLGAVISGVDIKVTAAAATGSSGGGAVGTPASQLTLSATPQTIISNIGSAYTGDGASNGHNLSYSVVSATGVNYQDLSATATATATVTYTISDN
jgi:primosomal replication protein N